MAIGDDKRARNKIDYETGLAQNNLNNLRSDIKPQNQNFWNNYTSAVNRQMNDYGDIQGQFKNFADTGGYTPQNLAAIRSRSTSPLRTAYANANREVDRARSLGGGYAPNYIAAKSRMVRDQGQAASDASMNTEGMIGQMVNQGKQFGVSGQAGMYGATPGMVNVFGNQLAESNKLRLGIEGNQNDLSLGTERNIVDAGRLPGRSQIIGNGIMNAVNAGAGIMSAWG